MEEEITVVEPVSSLCMFWMLVSLIFSYFYAYRDKHLDRLGAFIAFISLSIHFSAGYRKRVFIHCAIPAIWALMLLKLRGWEDKCVDSEEGSRHITSTVGLIIGHYGFIVADNWSSDTGALDEQQTSNTQEILRRVFVLLTEWFLRASKAALFIALTFVLLGHLMVKCSSAEVQSNQWLIPPLIAFFGIYGRLIIILLDMWLPFKGWCVKRGKVVWKLGPTAVKVSGLVIFDKSTVNVISMLLTAALTARVLVSFL
ncbi:hypothetical protein Ancab_006948 [Ancistrocladus abbreviatus]